MNDQNAEQNLQFIREMIEKTKKGTANQWKFLYLWGLAVILAVTGMNFLILIKQPRYIWINWMAIMGIAVIIQILLVKKEINTCEVKTYTQNAITYLSFSSGIAYVLAGFVFPILKIYNFGVIPIIVSIITGVLLFTIGGIVNWSYLKWSGVLWFISSVIMIYLDSRYRTLVFVPLIIQSYLIPAYILKREYKKNA